MSGVAEVECDLGREELLPFQADPAVHHATDGVARGGERATHVQQVMTKPGDPLADDRRGPLLHMVLEVIDLVVHGIDQVEVALRDVVEEMVEDHARTVATPIRLAGRAHVAGVIGLFAGGRLADGEDDVVGQDDVDLLVEDPVLLRDGDCHEHDAEDVVVVALDCGPCRLSCFAPSGSRRPRGDGRLSKSRSRLHFVGRQVDPLTTPRG